jgi:hypothetical protein
VDTSALLEAAMLTCFGLSWPVSSFRMLRARRPEGRSIGCALIVLCGYGAGLAAKVASVPADAPLPGLFWFYLLNSVSILVNIALQRHFASSTAHIDSPAIAATY